MKIKTKTKSKRNPIFLDEKYTGEEPTWERKLTADEVDGALHKGFNYYNYFYKGSDFKDEIAVWLTKNSKLSNADIAKYKNSTDQLTPTTLGALVRMHDLGAPLTKKHIAYIINKVQEIIAYKATGGTVVQIEMPASGNDKNKTKDKKPEEVLVFNIQTRMLQQARDIAGEIDADLDNVLLGKKASLNIGRYLSEKQISKPVASKIRAFYEVELAEIKECRSDDADEQLKEAYAFLKADKWKKLIAWYENTLGEIDNYIKLKALDKKPRKKKSVSADKLVSKLKYLKNHSEYGIVSIRPVDIVGAEQLWIFNVKTRKLGVYNAEYGSTLSIKGTTVVNFDKVTSVAKTLRKPKEKCSELLKSGKVQLRKFIDGIKATQINLNGRINADTVLLRVV